MTKVPAQPPISTSAPRRHALYATARHAAVHIAPSILNADFGRLQEQVEAVAAEADWIHLDIMDGHFVPNISFGPSIVALVNRITALPLDVHLMVDNPVRFVHPFVEAGADSITIHCELDAATINEALGIIRAAGVGAGLALNPDTPPEAVAPYLSEVQLVLAMSVFPGFGGQEFIPATIGRVRQLNQMRETTGALFAVEVDGGVDESNIPVLVDAGATMLVIGSRIFRSPDIPGAIHLLRGMTRRS